MRSTYRILSIALMALTVEISCQFLSGTPLVSTSEPSPPIDDSVLKFDPVNLPDAQQGAPYQVEIKVENVKTFVGKFSVEDGNLPQGLSLERVPGENAVSIIGVPTEKGTFTFMLYVWCEGTNSPGQTGQKEYTITVK